MAHISVNQTGQPSFKAQARLRTEGELSSAQNGGVWGVWGADGLKGLSTPRWTGTSSLRMGSCVLYFF